MLSKIIPGFLKESVGSVSRKQWVDITLFCGGLYCIYRFGGKLSTQIDNLMPNEEAMQRMIQEMQNGGGMMGPPGRM